MQFFCSPDKQKIQVAKLVFQMLPNNYFIIKGCNYVNLYVFLKTYRRQGNDLHLVRKLRESLMLQIYSLV